jgi:DNA-binding helix-hairpin-helix protein with protein kinase domain
VIEERQDRLFAGDRFEYRLGEKIAEGGEGRVYAVEGRRDVLVKLYKEPDPDREEKLRLMVDRGSRALRRVAAWPLTPLMDADEATAGFAMERLTEWRPLHSVYQIRSRLTHFPQRNFAFLVRVARNLSTCVHHLHEHGVVVGDLNESNAFVGPDAMVKLIDADSFQIEENGRVFPCKVAKGELLAPELQGKLVADTERTTEHDRFALAVLIFQTLVFGRHPFAGRPGKELEEVSLEEAIGRGYYVFSQRRDVPLRPPPFLTLDWLPPNVRELFERAFDPAEPSRPSAKEWYFALKELEGSLASCDLNGSHAYWFGHSACPWCELEAKWNVSLFRPTFTLSSAPGDLDALWSRLEQIAGPGVDGPLEVVDYRQLTPSSVPWWTKFGNAWFFFPVILNIFIYSFWLLPLLLVLLVLFGIVLAEYHRTTMPVRRSEQRLRALREQWDREANPEVFAAQRRRYADLVDALKDFKGRFEAERQRRIRELYQSQLEEFLRKYSVLTADAGPTGSQRLSSLYESGMKTAADITPASVRGFEGASPGLAQNLLAWRNALEVHFWGTARFRLPPSEEQRILAELRREDERHRRELLDAEERLRELAERLERRNRELEDEAAPLRERLRALGPRQLALEQGQFTSSSGS